MLPLIASCLIHALIILLTSNIISRTPLVRSELVAIELIALPSMEQERPNQKQMTASVGKKPTPAKAEKVKEVSRSQPAAVKPAVPAMEEPQPPVDVKPSLQTKEESTASFSSTAQIEGGGSEAGTGNLFGKGDVAVVPGSGTSGGGGTAASGLGRGSGAAGLPALTTPLRTHREAKPLQAVRAAYPAMALRMGLEGDVILKIEVDAEGKVTKAEITKSAGMGFDDEALKAVRQSRFEPAHKDGKNVPAEFTYIYRFRLTKK